MTSPSSGVGEPRCSQQPQQKGLVAVLQEGGEINLSRKSTFISPHAKIYLVCIGKRGGHRRLHRQATVLLLLAVVAVVVVVCGRCGGRGGGGGVARGGGL